ncbi:MAG: DUF1292 domain-containing protein [Solirubrobacterales bacterium]
MAKDDCKHDGECNHEEESEILILVDEDGEEQCFELIAELEIENQNYIVAAPLEDDEEAEEAEEANEEDEEDEMEVFIFKVDYDEEGNMMLAEIEDDEEWEMVADAWQELCESEGIQ